MNLRSDADGIIKESLAAVLPDAAVAKALTGHSFGAGRIVLVAVGKAAWQMARAAHCDYKIRSCHGGDSARHLHGGRASRPR